MTTPLLALWGKNSRGGSARPYPLIGHLLDTSVTTGLLWDQWLRPGLRDILTEALAPGQPRLARKRAMLAAGLHDIGKINGIFQGRTASPMPPRWAQPFREELREAGFPDPLHSPHKDLERHEFITMHHLLGTAGDSPTPFDMQSDPTEHYLAVVGGGHHGNFPKPKTRRDAPRQLRETLGGRWGEQADAHVQHIFTALDIDGDVSDIPPLEGDAATALVLLSGLVVLADWLASDDAIVEAGRADMRKPSLNPVRHPKAWMAARHERYAAVLPDTLGIYEDIANPREAILGEFARTPTDLQQQAVGVGEGLWLVTYPTGDGKTEAAMLRHVSKPGEGVLFALPTRATTNAMMKRMRGFMKGTSNKGRLSHGYAILDDFNDPAERSYTMDGGCTGLHPSEWLSKGSRNSLLAPVTVSTCDQVLLTALRQKGTPLRLLALANRHIVLDEVHTYSHYETALLCSLLSWLARTGTRVTLLSATLPTWQRNQLVSAYDGSAPAIAPRKVTFPSSTLVRGNGRALPEHGRSRREYDLAISIEHTSEPHMSHLDLIQRSRARYPNARIAAIVNVVDRAIDVADMLQQRGHDVTVLHSRMTAGHREEVGTRLTTDLGKGGSPTKGTIVVGTQVIEASLDIDFDVMTTDLAPAASLVQRAGRAWRREDPDRHLRVPGMAGPTLHVAAHMYGDRLNPHVQMPYLPMEQAKTLESLSVRRILRVPDDVQRFVDDSGFSWEEVQDIVPDSDDAEHRAEWLAFALRRIHAAASIVIPLEGEDGYLASPSYRHLYDMTSRNILDESTTRFTEYDSGNYLLIDRRKNSTVHSAWDGTVEQLAEARTTSDLMRALAASIPANGKLNDALAAAHARTVSTWEPRAGILAGLLPVDMALVDDVYYDQRNGLSLRKKEGS